MDLLHIHLPSIGKNTYKYLQNDRFFLTTGSLNPRHKRFDDLSLAERRPSFGLIRGCEKNAVCVTGLI